MDGAVAQRSSVPLSSGSREGQSGNPKRRGNRRMTVRLERLREDVRKSHGGKVNSKGEPRGGSQPSVAGDNNAETESDLSDDEGPGPARSVKRPVGSRASRSEHSERSSDQDQDPRLELSSDEEWTPMREDLESRGPIGFDTGTEDEDDDEEEEAQPRSSATLPCVGSKHGGTHGRGAAEHPAADPGWKETDDWRPKDIPFTAVPGPRAAAAALQTDNPVDFLELFLSDELLEGILDQTNLYAEQCMRNATSSTPHGRALAWKPVHLSELKVFLGLQFLTAIVHKPELSMYWSTEEVMTTPYFNQTMSRNRFQIIWRYIHFSDNRAGASNDRMYKVRPVLDFLVSKFREMYQPNRNICIDEGTLLFRGRLHVKENNGQPARRGIKSYVLCDSTTAYRFNMKPVYGQNDSKLVDTVEFLLGGLAGHGYRLFIDNSVEICKRLLELNTHACGTLRKSRGVPPSVRALTERDLGVGDTVSLHNDKMMVLAWRDETVVRMVSTFHRNEMVSSTSDDGETGGVQAWQRGHPSQRFEKEEPACVADYNAYMNGAYKMVKNNVYNPLIRKATKWTNKFVVYYLFDMCMFNAFVLYEAKNPHGDCTSLLSFKQRVIRSWTSLRYAAGADEVESYNPPPAENPRAPHRDPQSRLYGGFGSHVLVALHPTAKKKTPTKKCRVCSKNKRRRETRYYCKSCNIPLCKKGCFTRYHSEQNYIE